MTIYYVLFAVSIGLGFLNALRIRIAVPYVIRRKDEKRIITGKDLYLFIVFAFMAVIIGFRSSSVGIDSKNYVSLFYNIQENGLKVRSVYTEIVNALLAWICGKISNEPQVYFIVHAVLICVSFGAFIRNNSEDVFLSTIVFVGMFFVPSMNLMRQWLAMAFGATAYTYYHREMGKKAIVLLLLAILCHTTAVVLLIIPIVERIKKKRYVVWPIIGLSVLMIVFRVRIFSLATNFISRYEYYFSSQGFLNEGLFNIKNLIFLAIILGIAYVLVFRRDSIQDEKTVNTLYIYEILMILALAFSLCGTTYSMFHRVVYYFSFFLVLMLPSITNRMAFGKALKVVLIAAMFFMLYRSGVSDNNGIAEYCWCWQ